MDRSQRRIAFVTTTGVGFLGAVALAARALRPRGDDSSPLPGDDLVPGATIVETHQIDIDAPAATIWPWLVQLGYGRGGFYSFDLLERLAGVGMTNARRIEPQWQDLAVGDQGRLHPSDRGESVGGDRFCGAHALHARTPGADRRPPAIPGGHGPSRIGVGNGSLGQATVHWGMQQSNRNGALG